MKNKRGYSFKKLKGTIVTLSLVCVSVCCVLFYQISRQALLQRTCLLDVTNLRQVQIMAADMKHIVGNISYQVYNDPLVAYLLYGEEFEPTKITPAMAQLQNYRNANPYVDSIYIYNANWDSISVSSSQFGTFDAPLSGEDPFFDKAVMELLRNRTGFAGGDQPVPRIVEYKDKTFMYYTYLTSDSYPGSEIRSTVFVNFSGAWMDGVITADGATDSNTLILDEKGRVISGNSPWPVFTDLSGTGFYQEVRERPEAEGYLLCDIDGEKKLVSFYKPSGESWQYIRLTPYERIIGEIDRSIRSLLIAAVVLILVGSLVAYLLSLRLSRPIRDMQQNVQVLEQEARENRLATRQHKLQNLLYGYASPAALQADGTLEGLKGEEGGTTYLLVLIKLRGQRALHQLHDTGGRSLLRYAVLNVASEIFSQAFSTEPVDMGGAGYLALILQTPDEKWKLFASKENLFPILMETADSIRQALELELNCIVSEPFSSLEEISSVYALTREAALHCIFYPPGYPLFAGEVLESRERFTYPQAQEDRMVEAILNGHEEEACRLMRKILQGTRRYPFSAVTLTCSHLSLAISGIVDEVQKNRLIEFPESLLARLFSFGDPYEAESIEEIEEGFAGIIRQIIAAVGDKRSARHADLLAKINQLLAEQYRDPGCCLDSIAGQVGLSSAYVGKIYKRGTLKSISEQILELRMEEARRLLRENPKMTVTEIAEYTGFSTNSYFSKVFHKKTGMTPNEYRSLNRKGGSG